MKVKYRKKFLKQLARTPHWTREQVEKFAFEELPKVSSIGEIGKIEKMTGYDTFYKARFGEYRVGMKLENEELILQTIMNRKDIYKFFP